ncbi:MAG: hypothetical protein ACRETH_14465 [Steroidobacteraceae bacterium]
MEPNATFSPGDVLAYSWGYDQTNIEFFEVTRATAKSVWLRAIAATVTETGFMCGDTAPVVPHQPASHCSVALNGPRRIVNGTYGPHVSMPYGIARRSMGTEHCSWYA